MNKQFKEKSNLNEYLIIKSLAKVTLSPSLCIYLSLSKKKEKKKEKITKKLQHKNHQINLFSPRNAVFTKVIFKVDQCYWRHLLKLMTSCLLFSFSLKNW